MLNRSSSSSIGVLRLDQQHHQHHAVDRHGEDTQGAEDGGHGPSCSEKVGTGNPPGLEGPNPASPCAPTWTRVGLPGGSS